MARKKSTSKKAVASRNFIKEVSKLADKIQASEGKRTVTKTVYKMNRNQAVKEAARTLKKERS